MAAFFTDISGNLRDNKLLNNISNLFSEQFSKKG